jgi:hypothetical protein
MQAEFTVSRYAYYVDVIKKAGFDSTVDNTPTQKFEDDGIMYLISKDAQGNISLTPQNYP